MRAVRDLVLKAARTSSKGLIEGENGTGKELVARAIHHSSAQADRPFVAVNCAAIPEALIESELFGHRKGAFTGAVADRVGRFQAADGGTLFLDEIGDMSPVTQAKVLRVIETEAFERVGSNETLSVEVRLIAATNQDLRAAMAEGRFREDLFFRINVLSIRMPPLRERREDIPALVTHYVRFFCQEHGIRLKTVDAAALDRLSEHAWPGNVRELRNLTEKLVVLVERENVGAEDVSLLLRSAGRTYPAGGAGPLTLREAKERFERDFIREGLEAEKWNVTKAADRLGIPRTYLHKKIRQMGIGS
jgi:two-component system nitrogen regulation response regulator NtrX